MSDYPSDIYTEPFDLDVQTLSNLGPTRMAGIWTEPFHHTDRNTLSKIGEATPNPLVRAG